MFCAWMKKKKKSKIKQWRTLSDCSEMYENGTGGRYAIIDSLVYQRPLFVLESYEQAKEVIELLRKTELYPTATIVDLKEYGEWKSAYDKEAICKEVQEDE